MSENQEIESLENPFIKLAPEVVAHILSFLIDIPSLISASGVCHLWRELVDWKEVKQLQLDFGQMQINEVPLAMSKWSAALESLLPKVKLTSLKVLLPRQASSNGNKCGAFYLPWPLYLLDCAVTVNQLTNQQAASLSHITHVIISGRPDNSEFEFVCHLLELCPSLTHLNLSLNSDKFNLGLLKSALRDKRLMELEINISHLTGNCSSEHFAQLCQMLAPGTLKSLTLIIGNEDATDNPYVFIFIFIDFCMALHNNSGCLSALDNLIVEIPKLDLTKESSLPPDWTQFQLWSLSNHIPSLVNGVLPQLKMIQFTIPVCHPGNWRNLASIFSILSQKFNHPLIVTLSTSHCVVFRLYANSKSAPAMVHITQDGFNCKLVREFGQEEGPIEFNHKRLPPIGPTPCVCHACISEYGLVKQELINRLNGKAEEQIHLFSCQIPRLQVDLVDLFPSLHVSRVQNGSVKFKAENKASFSVAVIQHNSFCMRNICVGCGMLP